MSRISAEVDGLVGWRDGQPDLFYDYGATGESKVRSDRDFSPASVMVGLFVLMALTISTVPKLNVIPKGFGILLLLTYIAHMYRRRLHACPEVKIYLAWLLWTTMGVFGLTTFAEKFFFWERLLTIYQVWALMLIVSGFVRSQRTLSFVLLMFLLGAIIVGGYSWMTGEFRRVASQVRYGRVEGLAGNANSFAILMVYATACLGYFWMLPTRSFWARLMKRVLLVQIALLLMYGTMLSGSRKGALALVLLYAAWVFFCYRRDIVRKPVVLVTVVIAAAIGIIAVVGYIQTSELGRRFQQSFEGFRTGGVSGGLGDARSRLYRAAGRMIAENPFTGVGLDCFRVHSGMGAPAHSEYAEIPADTGLVGAAIYFSWYIVFLVRLIKIRKWTQDPLQWKITGLALAMFLVVCILNFGAWIYHSKVAFLFLGCFWGYTMVIWREIRDSRREHEHEHAT